MQRTARTSPQAAGNIVSCGHMGHGSHIAYPVCLHAGAITEQAVYKSRVRTEHRLAARCKVVKGGAAVAADADDDDIEVPSRAVHPISIIAVGGETAVVEWRCAATTYLGADAAIDSFPALSRGPIWVGSWS